MSRESAGHAAGSAYFLVFAATLAGLLPHWPNFTPVFGAMLLGGARLQRRDALWYPLLLWGACVALQARWIYHSPLGWGSVAWALAGMGPVILAGTGLRRRAGKAWLAVAATAGATGFFLVSNFGVWWGGALYAKTWAGLSACFLAAVPFYGNSVLAGLLFGALLLAAQDAAHAALPRRQPAPALARGRR